MTVARESQVFAESVAEGVTAARESQLQTEVVAAAASAARESQIFVEVVAEILPPTQAQESQVYTEVVAAAATAARESQVFVEVVAQEIPTFKRDITSGMQSAGSDAKVLPVLFVALDFPSGIVRVCSAGYSLDWDGFSWVGAGELGTVEPIEEGTELQSRGVALTLSGVPIARIGQTLNEEYQGRDATIWLAFLDPDSYQVVADPTIVFKGQMDVLTPQFDRSANTQLAAIRLTCESRFVRWEQSRVRRYTHEDQQLDYPGDKFFEYVPRMQEIQISWGPD